MRILHYGDPEPDHETQWRTASGYTIAYIQNGWSYSGSIRDVPWKKIHVGQFPMTESRGPR